MNLISVLPAGIGIVPVSLKSSLTHSPETPDIKSPMFMITRGEPSPAVQQFIDFYLKVSHFSPIEPAPAPAGDEVPAAAR